MRAQGRVPLLANGSFRAARPEGRQSLDGHKEPVAGGSPLPAIRSSNAPSSTIGNRVAWPASLLRVLFVAGQTDPLPFCPDDCGVGRMSPYFEAASNAMYSPLSAGAGVALPSIAARQSSACSITNSRAMAELASNNATLCEARVRKLT